MDDLIQCLHRGVAEALISEARDYREDRPMASREKLKAHLIECQPAFIPADRREALATKAIELTQAQCVDRGEA